MDPLELFDNWYQEEKMASGTALPGACCLTTLGGDGFPNSRFVSLKEVNDGRFMITGPTDVRKGQEIAAHPKVALAFWWPVTILKSGMAGGYISNYSLKKKFHGT